LKDNIVLWQQTNLFNIPLDDNQAFLNYIQKLREDDPFRGYCLDTYDTFYEASKELEKEQILTISTDEVATKFFGMRDVLKVRHSVIELYQKLRFARWTLWLSIVTAGFSQIRSR
jgi:hypothetical protein